MNLPGRLKLIPCLLLFATILFSACKKEHSGDLTPDEELQANVASTQAEAEADVVFNSVFEDVFGANNDVGILGVGVISSPTPPPCLTTSVIHLTTDPWPIKIIYDFGAGCMSPDGHLRKGRIIATYTNRLTIAGAKATIEFENFFIDSVKVEGVHKIANTSSNTTVGLQFAIDVSAKLLKPNGNYTEWSSHKKITQTAGNITPQIAIDDVYKIEGNTSGITRRNDFIVGWNATIVEPLMKALNCRWVKKGAIRITRQNLSANSQWVGVLDFGTGTCDNRATLSINGRTVEIFLY
ncbi:MAG: hypothetical protein C4308_01370 [Chitinophagaceae bacterium]